MLPILVIHFPHINTALAADSAPPRAAVQERRQRCGSDLRSGDAAIDVLLVAIDTA